MRAIANVNVLRGGVLPLLGEQQFSRSFSVFYDQKFRSPCIYVSVFFSVRQPVLPRR